MNHDLRAVVTGHSRGLGAAIAGELLTRGIAVLGISRGGNTGLAEKHAARLREVRLDLADASALSNWLAGGGLREFFDGAGGAILVNNAGILQPVGPLARQDVATVGQAISINVAAPLMLSAAFAAATHDVADRRILHVSSGAGRSAYAGWSIYCASKAALDHHARAVALDHTQRLRICSLAPGVIDTDMQAEVRASAEEVFPTRERFVKLKREGGLAQPEETAVAIADMLLSGGFGDNPVSDLR